MGRNSAAYYTKSKSKVRPNIVKVKGKDITSPTEIANPFNNFFINIGPNLSKTILNSNKPFKAFLKNSSLNSFLFKATSEDEVHKLVSQLNKGKALGPLSIPVLEKSMYNRIYSFLCKHKLINTTQFGFRSKLSTEHALISLIETIRKYLGEGEIACGVFINLQKAFDTVNHDILPE